MHAWKRTQVLKSSPKGEPPLSTQVDLWPINRKCTDSLPAILVLTLLSAVNATASTTWTITIDVTGPTIAYKVQPSANPDCPYSKTAQNPQKLMVCQGDTIVWQAVTSPDQNGNMNSLLFVMQPDYVLEDASGNPAEFFSAATSGSKKPTPTSGGASAPTVPVGIWHEWYVVVYDLNSKMPYFDDPRYIFGGGMGGNPKLCDDATDLVKAFQDRGEQTLESLASRLYTALRCNR
jgi:hypothetical protein